MFRRHNTNIIDVNMDVTILNDGSKYGLCNKLKSLSLIIRFISDSTTANAKMNCFLNIWLFLSPLETGGSRLQGCHVISEFVATNYVCAVK